VSSAMKAKRAFMVDLLLIEQGQDVGVLGIFPRKQTKSSRAAAISGLPGGITFPEPVNIPRLST